MHFWDRLKTVVAVLISKLKYNPSPPAWATANRSSMQVRRVSLVYRDRRYTSSHEETTEA